MAAGTYFMHSSDNESNFVVTNVQSREHVIVLSYGDRDPQKEWKGMDGGVLQFVCADGNCALKQLWTNRGFPAHEIPSPKVREGGAVRVALVRAATAKWRLRVATARRAGESAAPMQR